MHDSYTFSNFKASYELVIFPLRDLEDYEPIDLALVKPHLAKAKKERTKKVGRKGADEQNIRVQEDGIKVMENK